MPIQYINKAKIQVYDIFFETSFCHSENVQYSMLKTQPPVDSGGSAGSIINKL